MIHINALKVGQMATNCYLVWDPEALECIIIDPGDDAEYIINRIQDLNLIPTSIVATHAHFDHIQAILELQLGLQIPFLIHKADLALLNNYRSSAKYYTGFDPGPAPNPDKLLINNAKIKIGDSQLQIIHTPGHTPGSICLYSPEEKIIFTGDTLLANGEVGRTDHAYSSPLQLQKSINKIVKLPEETIFYPGHGESTKIATLR